MKRISLGGIFFAWLYGVPFLLVVGLIRRTSTPYTPTREAAEGFGATTDALLIVGLTLNAVLPLAGLMVAVFADDHVWRRLFGWALGGMMAIYLVVGLAGSTATSLIGHVPDDQEPDPAVTQCIPTSGGRGCPGG
jgi:hypothetical protein